jgi:uncharacterized cupin superfamily protein
LLQVLTIPPNTLQKMHFHDQQTEVFYILEGEATITINHVDYPAGPGDVHSLWNKTDQELGLPR